MRTSLRLATGAAVVGLLGLGAPAAYAQSAACLEYADACVDSDVVPDARVAPVQGSGSSTGSSNLPRTGGETVLLGLIGAGTVATGAALVVAGRRRSSAAA